MLGPFLVGILAVVTLTLLPGASGNVHLGVVFACLIGMALLPCPPPPRSGLRWQFPGGWTLFFTLTAGVAVCMVAFNATVGVLVENDALEYATVGRILYESHTISAYPALQPELTRSGFYGPWTHPPLYVALAYVSYVLQGSSDLPILFRMIGTWFTLGTMLLVYALGRGVSQRAAGLCVLLFISSPTLFAGAANALVDPLPISGLALILALIAGLDPKAGRRRAIGLGVALGLSLWTHSQAILFIPLLLVMCISLSGLANLRQTLKDYGWVLLVAMALACWPYLNNLRIFGSLVSDMPVVFSLPSLNWDEYFSVARGIDDWRAKLQYGLFKGWAVPEAYALSFWAALLGITAITWRYRRNARALWREGSPDTIEARTGLGSLALLFTYLGGVLCSVLMGIDLMIRNERYWLVLMPAVAILGAIGLDTIFRQRYLGWKRWLLAPPTHFLALCVLCFFLLEGLMLQRSRIFAHDPQFIEQAYGPLSDWSLQPGHQLESGDTVGATGIFALDPAMHSMAYFVQRTAKDALVLALRPSDMFYSQRKMVSYLDPRLLDFYAETDPSRGLARLLDLGIDYVHMPDYYLPPVYNSTLQQILGDNRYSKLVYSAQGHQIYQLGAFPAPSGVSTRQTDLTHAPWQQYYYWKLLGRADSGRRAMFVSKVPLAENGRATPDSIGNFFARDRRTALISSDYPFKPGNPGIVSLMGRQPFEIEMRFTGGGNLRFGLDYYDADMRPLYTATLRISELALHSTPETKWFKRRLIAPARARYMRVVIEYYGSTALQLQSVIVTTSQAQNAAAADRQTGETQQ